MKSTVNSYDIFDTLIARKCMKPDNVFDDIEKTYPFPNFKSIRIQSEIKSNGTLDNIYVQFQKTTNITDEELIKLKHYELSKELDYSIPIVSNINKIRDGDIYISDMYLSEENIKTLLNKHGININNKLYVSPNGKGSGKIYEKLLTEYEIITHTGDNEHSDISQAKKYGINVYHTKINKYTNFESSLVKSNNIELSNIFRNYRLQNPYDETTIEYRLYEEQAKYNIPILLYIAKTLNEILLNENRNTILFLTRDGCLLKPIVEQMYPHIICKELHASRAVHKNYNDIYMNYLKENYNHDTCILFDMCGSFSSGRKLYMEVFGFLPRIHIFNLHTNSNSLKKYDGLTYSISRNSNGDKTEGVNKDIVGTLLRMEEGQNVIRMPLEISKNYAVIKRDTCLNFISKYDNDLLLNDINTVTESEWNELINEFYSVPPVIRNKDTKTLAELANCFSSDKGTKYACAHNYAKHYEKIIHYYSNVLQKDNINLLEIGLNRDLRNELPSLKIWDEYFCGNINIYGFDIYPQFLEHNGKYKNIKIYCGDQSKISDLLQLCENKYTILIDDGFHASMHQQISFKTLWDNIEPGGCYIIEDLHWQPNNESGMKTKELLINWQSSNFIESQYINKEEVDSIKTTIDRIELFDSESKKWSSEDVKNAFAVIYKKFN